MILNRVIPPALLLSLLASAGCSSSKVAEDHSKSFQGAWQSTGVNKHGRKVMAVFEKDQFEFSEIFEGQGATSVMAMSGAEKGAMQINGQATPAQVDFVLIDGPNQGKSRLGIYAFEEGKLKLCLADLGEPRPTGFSDSEKCTLLVLEPKQ